MTRSRLLLALPAVLLLAACATTDAAKVPLNPLAEAPQTESLGAIVEYQGAQVLKRGAWAEARIATSAGEGPLTSKYLRTADGRWRVRLNDGSYVLLEVSGNRITGEATNLTYTRVDGGFRLEGFWRYDQFSLLLTREKAVAAGREFLPDARGAYTAGGAAGTRILLEGRATGLGDPAWPQMALTAAAVDLGKVGGTYPENPGQVTPGTWR